MPAIREALVSSPRSKHSIVARTVSAENPKSSALSTMRIDGILQERFATVAAVQPVPPRATKVARTEAEAEAFRYAFEAIPPPYVDADLDYALAVARTNPATVRLHVVVVEEPGAAPAALAVGRIEESTFPARLGYLAVYRPRLRVLRLFH